MMTNFSPTAHFPKAPRLGILDADLGGLSLVDQIRSRWPGVPVIYLADTAHSPIGERSTGLIGRRLRAGAAYLHAQGVDMLVLASQSMAALAAEADSEPRNAESINPLYLAAAAAVEASRTGRIGVIGSSATVATEAYPKAIHARLSRAVVHCVAAPLLVPLLDADWQDKPEARMIVKKYLHRLKVRQVDTLIMAGGRYAGLRRSHGPKDRASGASRRPHGMPR